MAKAPAQAKGDGQAAAPKGPSLILQLVVLLVMTGVAAGAGLFAGGMLDNGPPATEQSQAHASDDAHGKKDAPEDPAQAELKRGVVALPPITTNLSGSGDVWVRMEVAAVFDRDPDPSLGDTIHQDLLAYLRTVKLHQVEGASGFQHLKADMEERARIRSDGKVSAILIKTLLFE